jgi:hypothetical protein
MIQRRALIPIATFIAGVATGVLATRDEPGADSVAAAANGGPASTRAAVRPAADPDEAARKRIAADLSRVSGERGRTAEFKQWLDGLAADDLPLAMLAIAGEAGPDGVPHAQRSVLEQLMERWIKVDREGALRWAESLQPGMRRYFVGIALEAWAEDDPLAAWAWIESSGEGDKVRSRSAVARKALQVHANRSAADAAAFIASLPKENSRGSVSLDYPEGFDFRAFLDGLAALGGKLPGIMPDNALGSWAANDPDAAHEWALGHEALSFQDWGKVVDAVEAKSGREAAASWAAGKYLAADEEARRRIAREISDGFFDGRLDLILGTAAAIEDPQTAWDFTREVVTSKFDPKLRGGGVAYQLIERIETPEGRADAIAHAMAFRSPVQRGNHQDDAAFERTRLASIEAAGEGVAGLPADSLAKLGLAAVDISRALERLKQER